MTPSRQNRTGNKQVNDSVGKNRKVVSARGEKVDFDLLKIKAQINESSPKSVDVVARERFIDKKRRRTNRKTDEMLAQQADAKRYAEDAMRLQQDQKKDQDDSIFVEIVALEEPKIEEPVEIQTEQKTKFNRKLNK